MESILTIERLTPDSAQSLLPDLARLLQDAVDGGASVGFLPPLDRAEAEGYWRGVCDALLTPYRILLVARQADALVGTVQLGLASFPNGAHRAEVMKLLVHSAYRRNGVGRRRMAAVEAEARRAGRTTLVLDTLEGDPAGQLYTALGYQRAGAIPEYAAIGDGSLQPTVVYYKLLAKNGA